MISHVQYRKPYISTYIVKYLCVCSYVVNSCCPCIVCVLIYLLHHASNIYIYIYIYINIIAFCNIPVFTQLKMGSSYTPYKGSLDDTQILVTPLGSFITPH